MFFIRPFARLAGGPSEPTQYTVTSIVKVGNTITLTVSGGTTVSVNNTTHSVYIMES